MVFIYLHVTHVVKSMFWYLLFLIAVCGVSCGRLKGLIRRVDRS